MKATTISLQEVRKDPLTFLRRLKRGSTITVIYHSKPLTTVVSVDASSPKKYKGKGVVAKAVRARATAQHTVDPTRPIKELYTESIAEKHGIS